MILEKEGQIKRIKNALFHSLVFESLNEFDGFVEEEISERLNKGNMERWLGVLRSSRESLKDVTWFGSPAPGSLKELEEHKEFQRPELYKEAEEEIRKSLSEFDEEELKNLIQIKKIAYNSIGFGIFSFDRAAMGLQRIKTRSGKEKITTSVKDVYAYFLDKPMEQRAVKIYVVAGGLGTVDAKEMLYNGMGAVVLADYLSQRNYSVEINVVIESVKMNGLNSIAAYAAIIKTKRFEDFLDRNLIAVLTSDPKYYRYKGFKGIISIYNKFGEVCPAGLGGAITKGMMEDFVREENTLDCTPFVIIANYSLEQIKENIIHLINQLKRKYAAKE